MNVPEGAGRITQEELNRQLTAVCKIEILGKGKATGFVGHLQINTKDHYYLITNHHVLQHKKDKSNVNITFEYSNMLSGKLSTKDSSGTDLTSSGATANKSITLSDKWFTDNGTNLLDNTKYGLDYTMIEVEKKEVDELKIYPFDLTPTKLDEDDQLIVAGHPVIDGVQQHLQLSFHRCKKILGFFVYYGCSTCKGSSGSPVLKVVDGKLRVVALHRACQEKYLNYGSLFSAVLSHASLIDGHVPETTVLKVKQFLEKVKWKPLEMADLLQLLQPVESSWDTLGRDLLKDKLEYKIDTIESDCFHDDNSRKALDEVLSKWRSCTVSAKRTWQTLCETAERHNDVSLEKFIQENWIERSGEAKMKDLQRWSRNSPLRTSWYNFAVDLVGEAKARVIHARYYGGGTHSCLQRMLDVWYRSTIDHSWQMIIDALTEMDKFPVIESIEKHCLTW